MKFPPQLPRYRDLAGIQKRCASYGPGPSPRADVLRSPLPAEQYDEGGTGGGGGEKSDPKKRDRSRRRKEKARDLNDNTGVNASRNKEERCLVPT